MVSTRSVAVVPLGSSPVRRNPTTLGISIEMGWPSMAASASMPPTPQPSTPRPFCMVVCESVPTQVSGYASCPSWVITTRARYSMFTWCTMPVPGGTTLNWRNASWPQRRNWNRSWLRWNSISTFLENASGLPYTSATTEWSMTSSAGMSGLILVGSPPRACMASRIAARSTTAGTPVRSCRMTRAGVNWISVSGSLAGSQFASALTWLAVMLAPSSLRSRFSSRIFRLKGRLAEPSAASSR